MATNDQSGGTAATASSSTETAGASPSTARLTRPRVDAAGTQAELIPGSEVLGRGIYIRPRSPYELKGLLLTRETTRSPTLLQIHGIASPYAVPKNCEVNESPPLPAGRSTGETLLEESWDRFGSELKVNVNASGGAKIITIDATAFHGSNLQTAEDSYYALRSSYIPFWSVYIPLVHPEHVIEGLKTLEENVGKGSAPGEPCLPEGGFDPKHRAQYARIFDYFGTHYIRSAWVGGKASLLFVITKSSHVSKEEIKSGIEVTFGGKTDAAAKGGTSTERSVSQERVRNNSTCKVFGSGGDQTMLAKLSSLEPEQYEKWVDSIKDNPQIIEFGVSGIWTLFNNEVSADALQQAYLEETTFTSLDAVVPVQDWLVFTKGDQAFDYTMTSRYGRHRLAVLSCRLVPDNITEPEKLRARLAPLFRNAGAGQDVEGWDANLSQVELKGRLAQLLNAFILTTDPVEEQEPFKTMPLPSVKKEVDEGVVMRNRRLLDAAFANELEPWKSRRSLADYLPVLKNAAYSHFQRPHAAFSMYGFCNALDSKIYLFKWQTCLRLDTRTETIDPGYPKPVVEEWPDVDFDRIDAAVSVAPDRLYFFRGGEYIRIEMHDGEPTGSTRDLIKNRWPGVIFDKIDTAVYIGSNRIYFFSEDQYILYNLASHRADAGYPKFLPSNYPEDWAIFR